MGVRDYFPTGGIEANERAATARWAQNFSLDTGADNPARLLALETHRLLAEGGDGRIALDPISGLNRYGCATLPDEDCIDFGSSTASIISQGAYQSVQKLHRVLKRQAAQSIDDSWYVDKMEDMRREFKTLFGIRQDEADLIFAASGTDIHLIVPRLLAHARGRHMRVLIVDPNETGSGVPYAVGGKHFSATTATGRHCDAGKTIASTKSTEVMSVAVRRDDGSLRPTEEVDQEFARLTEDAVRQKSHCLVVITDTTKTGCIAPSIANALALKARFPQDVDILVDACQFRISAATLRAYIDKGCLVALTGSKFFGGPTFSGMVVVPGCFSRMLHQAPLPDGLRDYSLRGDWPVDWQATRHLPRETNPGLVLRIEGALHEMRKFQNIPDAAVDTLLTTFHDAVLAHAATLDEIALLDRAPIDRRVLGAPASWDRHATIFPFFLRGSTPQGKSTILDAARVAGIHRLLQQGVADLSCQPDHQGAHQNTSARVRLGQPVVCGKHEGAHMTALRLNIGARQITEAIALGDQGLDRLLNRMRQTFNQAAALAAR